MQLFSKKIASVSMSPVSQTRAILQLSLSLSQGEGITYASDPLEDFTTIKFLDRFVYKNPKQKQSDHGGSAMQVVPDAGIWCVHPLRVVFSLPLTPTVACFKKWNDCKERVDG